MRKLYLMCAVLIIILVIGSCYEGDSVMESMNESSMAESSVEESIIESESEEMSAEESETPDFEGLVSVENEKNPCRFQVDEKVYNAELDELTTWIRENIKGDSTDIIKKDKSRQTDEMAGVRIETVEIADSEGTVQFAISNNEYVAVTLSLSEAGKRIMAVYRKNNPLEELYCTIYPQGENTIQDIVLAEDYLFWSETSWTMDITKSYWKVYRMNLSSGETDEVLSYEQFNTNYAPRLAVMGNRLVTCIIESEETSGAVCSYDSETGEWEELYYTNCIANPYSRLKVYDNIIYNTDYDGTDWYVVRYDAESKNLARMKLKLRYSNEMVDKCDWVGEWVIYSSSYGILYIENMYTGEVRYLDYSCSSFTGMGERYVIYTGSMDLHVYDIEEDKIYVMDSEEISTAYFYVVDREEVLVANHGTAGMIMLKLE